MLRRVTLSQRPGARTLTRPTTLLSAGALTLSLLLTGCSGNSTEAYCDDLRGAADEFEALEDFDPTALDDAIETFRDLADAAPDEVAAEWETMVGGIEDLEAAFAEAGLELSQLGEAMAGDLPEGVSQEDLQEVFTQLQEIDSEELDAAGETISEHADTECDVDLGLDG